MATCESGCAAIATWEEPHSGMPGRVNVISQDALRSGRRTITRQQSERSARNRTVFEGGGISRLLPFCKKEKGRSFLRPYDARVAQGFVSTTSLLAALMPFAFTAFTT